MKTSMGIAAIASTLTASLITGGVFFSPTAPQATPDVSGQITVVVLDDEGDAMEGLTVYGSDGTTTVEAKVDADGKADLTLPRDGNYRLYTTSVPNGFLEKEDGDGGANGMCVGPGLSSVRCVSVRLTNSKVTLPNSQDQILSTSITYEDIATPSPRIRVLVKDDNTGKFVTGGQIEITRPATPNFEYRMANTTGNTVTKEIQGSSRYDITFTAPAGYQLIPSSPPTRENKLVADRLISIEYRVVATGQAAEPMVSLEDEQAGITVGGEPFEMTETDETEAPETPADDEQPFTPAPVQPATEAPVEETPVVEEAPVEEAPVDEAPVEETPAVEEAPVDPTDELKADCFMYLEMYPELVELDPGLPSYCEVNPTDARRIISGLLDELGK